MSGKQIIHLHVYGIQNAYEVEIYNEFFEFSKDNSKSNQKFS